MQGLLDTMMSHNKEMLIKLLASNIDQVFNDAILHEKQEVLDKLYAMEAEMADIAKDMKERKVEFCPKKNTQVAIDTFPIFSQSDEGLYHPYEYAFIVACEMGRLHIVSELSEKSAVMISTIAFHRGLFAACENGSGHIVAWMTKCFKLESMIGKAQLDGAYLKACEAGCLQAVKLLHPFREDEECVETMDEYLVERSDLMQAITSEKVPVIRWLLQQEKISKLTRHHGAMILEFGCSKDNAQVVSALLEDPYLSAHRFRIIPGFIDRYIRDGGGRILLHYLGVEKIKELATAEQIAWAYEKIMAVPRKSSWAILPSPFVKEYLSTRKNDREVFFERVLGYKIFSDLRILWCQGISILCANDTLRRMNVIKHQGVLWKCKTPSLPVEVWQHVMAHLCLEEDITDPMLMARMLTSKDVKDDISHMVTQAGITPKDQGQCNGRSLSPV